jgi:ubiquinone/menaquinone biosynthesis C-methylase UbiE
MLQRTSEATGKPWRGMAMEGMVARWYARGTRIDMGDFQGLAERVAGVLQPGSRVIEVAPGPGYLAIELAKRGLQVEAVDASDTFVRIANEGAREAGMSVGFRRGDVHALPFADNVFDYLACRAAFKNFSRPVEALREMRRVVKPGAELLIIDMRRDVMDAEIDRFVASRRTGWLGALWNGWVFKSVLRKRAYLTQEFARMAAEAGFVMCDISKDSIGFEARLRA